MSSNSPDGLEEWVGKQIKRKCVNGHYYVVRQNKNTGEYFLGCSTYPRCRETDELAVADRLRLIHAPQLPGMEKVK